MYAWLGFNMDYLCRRRFLYLSAPEGFGGRFYLLRAQFAFTWAEVARLELAGEAAVRVHLVNGENRLLNFGNMEDGVSLRDQLLAHAQAHLEAKKA